MRETDFFRVVVSFFPHYRLFNKCLWTNKHQSSKDGFSHQALRIEIQFPKEEKIIKALKKYVYLLIHYEMSKKSFEYVGFSGFYQSNEIV